MPTWILCYHKVGPEKEEGRFLNVEPLTLRKQIQFLKRLRMEFVSANTLEKPVSRGICLTFDDAYHSMMMYGIEALTQERVTASIYVVPSLVGQESSWDPGKERPLADWPTIVGAQEAGFEIGNHTLDHKDLSLLSREEQTLQWGTAHKILTDYGINSQTVCYPYGKTNGDSTSAIEQAGYRIGLGLSKRSMKDQGEHLGLLPRIPISFGDQPPLLFYKLFIRPRLKSKQ